MATLAQRWIEEGRQEGLQEGVAVTVLRQLQRRVGILDAQVQAELRALPIPQLEQLSDDLPGFTNQADLDAWRQAYTAPSRRRTNGAEKAGKRSGK